MKNTLENLINKKVIDAEWHRPGIDESIRLRLHDGTVFILHPTNADEIKDPKELIGFDIQIKL